MDEQQRRLKTLEAEKERMIRDYLALQDAADELNERIYRTCCGVEALNAQILALREKLRMAALRPAPNGAAAHPPARGRS